MADYKEQAVSGKRWQRASRIVIRLPFGQAPTMLVDEESITEAGGQAHVTPIQATNLFMQFDPVRTFPLRNPITDELTGDNGAHADLQVLLYSLVRHMQTLRDEISEQGDPE